MKTRHGEVPERVDWWCLAARETATRCGVLRGLVVGTISAMGRSLLAPILAVVVVACATTPVVDPEPAIDPEQARRSHEAFADVARVLRHPRCLNCHTTTEFPRVGDDRRRHPQNVLRGPEDHGVPGMQCSSCHMPANQAATGLPGAPHWQPSISPDSPGATSSDSIAIAKESLYSRPPGSTLKRSSS